MNNRVLSVCHIGEGLDEQHVLEGRYVVLIKNTKDTILEAFNNELLHGNNTKEFISDDCPAEVYNYEEGILEGYLQEVNDLDLMAEACSNPEDIVIEHMDNHCYWDVVAIWLPHIVLLDLSGHEEE